MIQSILNRTNSSYVDYLSFLLYDYSNNQTKSCTNNFDKFLDNVKSLLAIFGNTTSPSDKVCAFDMQHFLSVANDWASTQVKQEGILYRLINLSRWNIPDFIKNLFS